MKNTIPESLLAKLYDATGTNHGNKGYIIVTVNANGDPIIVRRSENSCVTLALNKALEMFMDNEGQEVEL